MSVVKSQGWLEPFSFVGGLFVILYFVGKFLTEQYTSMRLNCDLTESLFRTNSAKETKINDRLSNIIEQRNTLTKIDVTEIWDRYFSHRKETTIRVCRVLLSCRGRSRDTFLLRNGMSKIDKALDVRSIIKVV